MRLIYMAHPVTGDVAANIRRARTWLRWLARHARECAVIAPWILDVELFELLTGEELFDWTLDWALGRDCEIVSRCDELWLTGEQVTSGCAREARALGKDHPAVRDFTGSALPPVEFKLPPAEFAYDVLRRHGLA